MVYGKSLCKKIYRGNGLGKQLIELIEKKTREMDIYELNVSSQYARNFYEKLGYTAVGEIYLDENVEHITLVKKI